MPDGEMGVGIITGHVFVPKGEWWSLCRECNLSEAAHSETSLRPKLPEYSMAGVSLSDIRNNNRNVAPPRHTFSGFMCVQCGQETIRTGTCHTCPSCGWNDGCG